MAPVKKRKKTTVKSVIVKQSTAAARKRAAKRRKECKATNFNQQVIRDRKFDLTQRFHNVKDVRVYYTSLKHRVLYHIEQWPVVVGCVAWLSERDILDKLGTKRTCGVSLVVNREDYLDRAKKNTGARSHKGFNSTTWKKRQLEQYDKLKPLFPGEKCAVRVFGLKMGRSKMPAAKMHHKFLVFCDKQCQPQAVWTGSFNLTYTASKSLENAMYIEDARVAGCYFEEYMSVYNVASPL